MGRWSGECAACGETAGSRRATGWQMERLRDRLARTGEIVADVVLASTLPRTMQSAEILAPVWGLPLVREDDPHELRPGIADGMRYDEAKARYPRADFTRESLQPAWPGGESWGMFTLRVGVLLDHVTREYAGKTVVLVTSGGVIHATFVAFCALPTLRLPAAWFQPGSPRATPRSRAGR